MQFITSGPDVPDRLIEAHEDGNVVFFCGAGISYPADLPGFRDLTKKTYAGVGMRFSNVAKAAMDANHYDMAFSLLERDLTGGRFLVRKEIVKQLNPNYELPGATDTHAALITLSKTRAGHTRLVTTNFDRIFEKVKSSSNDFPSYCAPLLPVPKKRWDGLVYLHGLIPETVSSANDLDCLVFTSGDFGLSYLTERWAARFVSELFRNYTICFVGYSIDDPVLRYMMDALASDRAQGENPPEAFAFAGYIKGQENETKADWEAKNVTPILYWATNKHGLLHQTLRAWSDTYRDGVIGKEQIVTSYALSQPTGSTAEDDYVGRLIWALSDPSGKPAKLFAEFDPTPTLDWLEKFEEKQFNRSDLSRFGINPHTNQTVPGGFSLIERPVPYQFAPYMHPTLGGDRGLMRVDAPMAGITNWICRHIANPNLLLWIAGKGGKINRFFRQQLQNALKQTALPANFTAAWSILLAGRVRDSNEDFDLYAWKETAEKTGLTPATIMALRSPLTPKVQFGEAYRLSAAIGTDEASIPFDQVVRAEIRLAAAHVWSGIKEIRKLPGWVALQPDQLMVYTQLLKEVFDLKAMFERADFEGDRSYAQRPSIEQHDQNGEHYDWTLLVDLVRDAWIGLLDVKPDVAVSAIGYWLSLGFPIFRRLAFFAYTRTNLISDDAKLDALLGDDGRWLWTIETKRETFQLLRHLAAQVQGQTSERLQSAILSGPPLGIFRDGLTDEQIEQFTDEDIWHRLAVCVDAGLVLNPTAADKLAKAAEAAEERKPKVNEEEEFASWSGTGRWTRRREAAPHNLQELTTWLKTPAKTDFFYEDDWSDFTKSQYELAKDALTALAGDGVWPAGRWRTAFMTWSQEEFREKSWADFNGLFLQVPDDVFKEIVSSISWWVQSIGKFRPAVDDNTYVAIATRVFELCVNDAVEPDKDAVFRAINSAVGQTADGLINQWISRGLKDADGLAEPFRSRFEMLANTHIPAYRYGRVLLCANLILFHRVDPDWAAERLVPLLDWDTDPDEARTAWMGFLWSARMHPELNVRLKPYLLQTSERVEELGEYGYTFIQVVIYLFLSGARAFSRVFQRDLLTAFSQKALEDASRALAWAHKNAGDQKTAYWENRVGPFIEKAWPKSVEKKSHIIARNFAQICIFATDGFPTAVEKLSPWLERDDDFYILTELDQSNLCSKFPAPALTFLDATVADAIGLGRDELTRCLTAIRTAAPYLVTDRRFVRLEDIVH